MDVQNRRTGYGFVVRDENEFFVSAKQVSQQVSYQEKEAEAIGIKEALKWIKDKGFDRIQVEMDALLVLQGIQTESLITSFDLIVNNVRELAKHFNSVSFMFVKRSANSAAHLLAR